MKELRFQPGLIVRTPPGGPYGGLPALVLALQPNAAEVSTGTALLTYERDVLTTIASVQVTHQGYRKDGEFIRMCLLHWPTTTSEYHIRAGRDASRIEVCKLLFIRLLEEGRL